MSDKQQEELQSAYKKMLKAVRLIESADMDLARAFDTASYPKVESIDKALGAIDSVKRMLALAL